MENINVGVVNLVLSELLIESYLNGSLLKESKNTTNKFINNIKSSPILQLEFKVFNNIENKRIDNEIAATRYIDNNIKLFETYTYEEVLNEKEKIKSFVIENQNKLSSKHDQKIKLYNAINNLILESIKDYSETNVDLIHESFITVLNHIRRSEPKNEDINIEYQDINENVIEIAINKFNEKYTSIDENDKNLLKKLIESSYNEKIDLFKDYKDRIIEILNSVKDESIDTNKILKTKEKIISLDESIENIDDNIIKLHELKKGLI